MESSHFQYTRLLFEVTQWCEEGSLMTRFPVPPVLSHLYLLPLDIPNISLQVLCNKNWIFIRHHCMCLAHYESKVWQDQVENLFTSRWLSVHDDLKQQRCLLEMQEFYFKDVLIAFFPPISKQTWYCMIWLVLLFWNCQTS